MVLSMVIYRYDYQAALGTTVQGEQSGIIPHSHDHSAGSIGAWYCCVGGTYREEAIDHPGKEGKPCHVLNNGCSLDIVGIDICGRLSCRA